MPGSELAAPKRGTVAFDAYDGALTLSRLHVAVVGEWDDASATAVSAPDLSRVLGIVAHA